MKLLETNLKYPVGRIIEVQAILGRSRENHGVGIFELGISRRNVCSNWSGAERVPVEHSTSPASRVVDPRMVLWAAGHHRGKPYHLPKRIVQNLYGRVEASSTPTV